jgi:hypothetical protein
VISRNKLTTTYQLREPSSLIPDLVSPDIESQLHSISSGTEPRAGVG